MKKSILLGIPIFIIQRYIKVQKIEREILILFSSNIAHTASYHLKVKSNKHTNYLVSTFSDIN